MSRLGARWRVGSWFSARVLNHESSREVPFDTRSEGMKTSFMIVRWERCSHGLLEYSKVSWGFTALGWGWGTGQGSREGAALLNRLDRILSRVGFLLTLGEAHGSERLRGSLPGSEAEAASPVRAEMNSRPGSLKGQARQDTQQGLTAWS